ncbi:MAG: histone deacetylase [Elusimicrobia bacterium]|nr:histone deacetylase [Elusimicrobiota bacterium]
MRFIFSPKYSTGTRGNEFPDKKFKLTADLLIKEGVASPCDFEEPDPPETKDLLLAHCVDWVERAMAAKLTPAEMKRLQLPWTKKLAQAHALAVTGTTLACGDAMDHGVGLHVGGGAHHAFPGHGEGFCAFNDIACAILRLRFEGAIERAAVVDLDVHQGNGTNAIFAGDKTVLTFSMHQKNLYPEHKFPGTIDIELKAGTRDKEYLRLLAERLPDALDSHRPDLVVYQAGVDPWENDERGGLKLTAEGLGLRDAFVFEACAARSIPVAVTLGGGYCKDVRKTAALHVQTLALAAA